MLGSKSVKGLFGLAADDIFNFKKDNQTIQVSFFEIYCSKVYDLLNNRNKLVLIEDANQNVNVIGLSEIIVSSPDELMICVENGDEQRITSSTNANYDSSRSHAILQIRIKEGEKEIGKISFIDLAGNERGADTYDNNKQTRLDGAEINKSLLALKECIRALDQEKKHTPFRGSKLTQVLKDSFVGNCLTIMIANVSPVGSCAEYTLNTLRYADRVKELSGDKNGGSKDNGMDPLSDKLMLSRQNKKEVSLPPIKNLIPIQKLKKETESPNILDVKNNFKNSDKRDSLFTKKPISEKFDLIQKNNEMNNNSSKGFKLIDKNDMIKFEEESQKVSFNKVELADRLNKKLLVPNISSEKESNQKPIVMDLKNKSAVHDKKSTINTKNIQNFSSKKSPPKISTKIHNKEMNVNLKATSFNILNKYFRQDPGKYKKEELEKIHSDIIEEMISYEDKFIANHSSELNSINILMNQNKNVLNRQEVNNISHLQYIDQTDQILNRELIMTQDILKQLNLFKSYVKEESLFVSNLLNSNKAVSSTREKRDMKSLNYEISKEQIVDFDETSKI